MRQRHRYRGIAAKGATAGEHLIAHNAERVDVGSRAHVEALGLLGGDVLGGAHDHAGAGERDGCGCLGDAKVGDLDLPVLGNHEVAGLDVAVHEPHVVDNGQAVGGLLHDVKRERFRQRAFAGQQIGEGFAADVFQGHEAEGAAVVLELAVVIGGDDIV